TADRLFAPPIFAIYGRRHGARVESGTARPVVTAAQSDDFGSILLHHRLAAHLEGDRLASPYCHAVGVSQDFDHQSINSSTPVCCRQRNLKTCHSADASEVKTGPTIVTGSRALSPNRARIHSA